MADDDLFFCDTCGDVFLDDGAKQEHESEVHGVRKNLYFIKKWLKINFYVTFLLTLLGIYLL